MLVQVYIQQVQVQLTLQIAHIYNNVNGDGTGITVDSGNPTITGNDIYGNYWRGIYINSGNAVISNNNIHNNGHATRNGDGINIAGGNPSITGNNIRNNAEDGIHVNGLFSGSSSNPLQIHYNSIVDNGEWGLHVINGGYVNAIHNWWGTNTPNYIRQLFDPSYPRDIFEQPLGISSQRVSWNPYLYLRISANTPIYNGDTSTITADLTRDNNNNIAPGTVPNGTSVTFSLTNGPYGSLTTPLVRTTTSGLASIIFTANDPNAPHTQNVRATVDHQQVTTGILCNPKANVVMTKTGNGPLNVGQTGTFTITLTNNGPNAATNVKVTDTVPTGFTAGTPSTGTYVGNIWTIPSLANGATATLTFNRVMTNTDAGSTKTNTATETQDTYNPTPITPKTATIHVNNAVLTITKTAAQANYNVGNNVDYTIIVGNNGPDTATNVVVTDTLPAGLTYVSSLGGSYNPGTRVITWNIASLDNGVEFNLDINCNCEPGHSRTDNTQHSKYTQRPKPNNRDITNTKHTHKQRCTNHNKNRSPGKLQRWRINVVYTLNVLNNGPDAATNVVVTDTLPARLNITVSAQIRWNLQRRNPNNNLESWQSSKRMHSSSQHLQQL